jgi:hypothetical protein
LYQYVWVRIHWIAARIDSLSLEMILIKEKRKVTG